MTDPAITAPPTPHVGAIDVFNAERRPITRDGTWMAGLTPDGKPYILVGVPSSGMVWIVFDGSLTDVIECLQNLVRVTP